MKSTNTGLAKAFVLQTDIQRPIHSSELTTHAWPPASSNCTVTHDAVHKVSHKVHLYSYGACAMLDVLLRTQPPLQCNQVCQTANMPVSIVNFPLLYALLHMELVPAHQADAGQILVVSYIFLLHVHMYAECFCSSSFWAAHQW